MNPITLPIAELKPALTGFGKIISRTPRLPVLNHVKIERTKDGWIGLTTTDIDHFITVRLEQPAKGEPVALLLPYDDLAKLVKNCGREETIHLHAIPETRSCIKLTLNDHIGGQQIAEDSKLQPCHQTNSLRSRNSKTSQSLFLIRSVVLSTKPCSAPVMIPGDRSV